MKATGKGFWAVMLAAMMVLSASFAYAGSTELVSVNNKGEVGNDSSYGFDLSADGRYFAFRSKSDNLVPGDVNMVEDIFVRDRVAGTTERVSVDSKGKAADDECMNPAISADGRYVVFLSRAQNLVEGYTEGYWQVYLHDRETGETLMVSVNSSGEPGNYNSEGYAAITPDGRYVAFNSKANNLVPGVWGGQIYVRDTVAGTIEPVSVSPEGVPMGGSGARITPDGRYVAFTSIDSSTPYTRRVYVRDRLAGTSALVSVSTEGVPANGSSYLSDISDDGRSVAFHSSADNLVTNDTNGQYDGFVRDMVEGVTYLVTLGSQGQQGDDYSMNVKLGDDGHTIVFCSRAANFDARNIPGLTEAYVRDLQTGITELWTVSSGTRDYRCELISDNLEVIGFNSGFDGYVPGDDNGWYDVFARTR